MLGSQRGEQRTRGMVGVWRTGQEYRGVAVLAPAVLPDRDAAIVTYCTGPSCPNSGQVADRLTALGYTNVRKYRESIDDWTRAGLPTESA